MLTKMYRISYASWSDERERACVIVCMRENGNPLFWGQNHFFWIIMMMKSSYNTTSHFNISFDKYTDLEFINLPFTIYHRDKEKKKKEWSHASSINLLMELHYTHLPLYPAFLNSASFIMSSDSKIPLFLKSCPQ